MVKDRFQVSCIVSLVSEMPLVVTADWIRIAEFTRQWRSYTSDDWKSVELARSVRFVFVLISARTWNNFSDLC